MTPAWTDLFSRQLMHFKQTKWTLFPLHQQSVNWLSSLTETSLSLHTSQYWRTFIIVVIISQELLLSFFFLINHKLTLLTMHCILHRCFSEIHHKTPSCFHQVSSHLQVLCYLFMNNQFSRSHSFLHSDDSIIQLLLSIPRWLHFHSLFYCKHYTYIFVDRHRQLAPFNSVYCNYTKYIHNT